MTGSDRTKAIASNRFRRGMTMLAAAATAAIMTIGLAACGGAGTSGGGSSEKIAVVASINQWGSVAEALGGDKVDVKSIMASTNVEAHDYEPTTSDVAAFAKAQVAVVNGADYDSWASKATEGTKADVVNAAETDGIKEGDNPHVWFSHDVREKTADAITAAYEKAMPDQKDYFEQRHKAWEAQEQKVEDKIKAAESKTKGVPYAASESVAWYLADDLGMTDATTSGYKNASANESEPSPADIKQFSDALKAGKMKVFVLNTQESNDTTEHLEAAAAEGDVPVVKLTEQMPKEYTNLTDWMSALVDDFTGAVK
ncbi:ABC transporter substrate-binding protein [Bifidobacterium sp. SMB2]|uniref:ABC transporter substrate-binding protein n=3 Tax=Bifidobacterium TaxID=1678 RepID=A0ABX0CE04_9BIFI|nr:ABC transporter substrate-binding protein [Bifidobacterium sp. SMB2]NEH10595.1 ABC transporter substrate-binding protein [Bifidobacterium saimiriisciurei]NEH10622.1 ABC transporter substrate-binding protein [Bifidobacterium saimiriisciurei]